MSQNEIFFSVIKETFIFGKIDGNMVSNALHQSFVNGNADEGRCEALGHRGQVMYRISVPCNVFALKLCIICPCISTEILFKDQLAVLYDEDTVDILISFILNTIYQFRERFFVHPDEKNAASRVAEMAAAIAPNVLPPLDGLPKLKRGTLISPKEDNPVRNWVEAWSKLLGYEGAEVHLAGNDPRGSVALPTNTPAV